jgi:hypothetical protein
VQVRQVPEPLVEVESVADEELVGNGEADVADGEVVDEAPVGPVEERRRRERPRRAEGERPHQVVQRQARVDHVLDEEDVPARDVRVQVLEQADPRAPARLGRAVAGELEEVEVVEDRQRAGEVGAEDEARLQRRDEERLAAGVVACELRSELGDPFADLLCAEVDLADAAGVYDARSRWYRCARRSRSRL